MPPEKELPITENKEGKGRKMVSSIKQNGFSWENLFLKWENFLWWVIRIFSIIVPIYVASCVFIAFMPSPSGSYNIKTEVDAGYAWESAVNSRLIKRASDGTVFLDMIAINHYRNDCVPDKTNAADCLSLPGGPGGYVIARLLGDVHDGLATEAPLDKDFYGILLPGQDCSLNGKIPVQGQGCTLVNWANVEAAATALRLDQVNSKNSDGAEFIRLLRKIRPAG